MLKHLQFPPYHFLLSELYVKFFVCYLLQMPKSIMRYFCWSLGFENIPVCFRIILTSLYLREGLAWGDWPLDLVDWPTIVLQCFDTVGWVIWPVKIVPNMTYNVFGGTLNPTLLLLLLYVSVAAIVIININMCLVFFIAYEYPSSTCRRFYNVRQTFIR